ncbi:MAG: aspartate-semialdehyde dehydrogenase [Candidatus Latescibacterota bacterium]
MSKQRVGILGATGMVGQRFVTLLQDHPWFTVTALAASRRSAGRTYGEAVADRWVMQTPLAAATAALPLRDVEEVAAVAAQVDFVFCAISLDKETTRNLEDRYARAEVPVVSANSAHRWTPDVPMLIPEVNAEHLAAIPGQRRRLGTRRGFVVTKPNCSIQSYVPALTPLRDFGPTQVSVCTFQAISGAGKTFAAWPEMVDNVIPYISGEEDKSVREPLKVWGCVDGEGIIPAEGPVISAQCIRVPVTDGHLAAVGVRFRQRPQREEVLSRWAAYGGRPQELDLPSAPRPFLRYCEEDDRPQTRLDRDFEGGMGVTIGRLRPDVLFDYLFVALSHNTLRGAAGGAVLTAELLQAEGYLHG